VRDALPFSAADLEYIDAMLQMCDFDLAIVDALSAARAAGIPLVLADDLRADILAAFELSPFRAQMPNAYSELTAALRSPAEA